jgi:hypothetical protein
MEIQLEYIAMDWRGWKCLHLWIGTVFGFRVN